MKKLYNIKDNKTIFDFGNEWKKFDQSKLNEQESSKMFNSYFKIFPKNFLNKNLIGFDMGCGSGRWAKHIAPNVKKLYCIDPSNSINIAKKNLQKFDNCVFLNENVYDVSLEENSMDFGYCLGVLHHVQNTEFALKNCVSKLKKGSPLLLYLYYSFENRPLWFKLTWQVSDLIRKIISKLPFKVKSFFSDLIALTIYLPLALFYKLFEKVGIKKNNLPLWEYRNSSFYSMRTDSLDRFGTKVEKRYSKKEIEKLMIDSGLINIEFSLSAPHWCAVGYKS